MARLSRRLRIVRELRRLKVPDSVQPMRTDCRYPNDTAQPNQAVDVDCGLL